MRVLILNFEKLGMSRHQALDNLKVWFERLQVEGQQVETEVEEEVGDKVLESRRTLTRHDTAMDILDEKENGVMSVKYRVKQSILRCRQQLRDMSCVAAHRCAPGVMGGGGSGGGRVAMVIRACCACACAWCQCGCVCLHVHVLVHVLVTGLVPVPVPVPARVAGPAACTCDSASREHAWAFV